MQAESSTGSCSISNSSIFSLTNDKRAESFKKLTSLIGNTPLVRIQKLLEPHKISCQVYAKCEFRNPSGSSWDRFVVNKIVESEQLLGKVHGGTHFVTGGNSQLCESLAWAGATGNFPVSVLPGNLANQEKIMEWKGFGANVILSFKQDPFFKRTRASLESHVDQLNITSGIFHRSVLPFPSQETVSTYAGSFANEILAQMSKGKDEVVQKPLDLIVCGGDNRSLLYGLSKRFRVAALDKGPVVVGVDMKENSFSESFSEENEAGIQTAVKWIKVSDAEAFDMTRRVLREEGLMIGNVSGAVMAATIKALKEYNLGNNPNARVLIVFPDSLSQSPSLDFLSTEWMVKKNYYDPAILESLYWYYDMALENVNPPVVMTVPPDAPVNIVWKAMDRSKADRAVVIDKDEETKKTTTIGIVTNDSLTAHMASDRKDLPVKDVCYKDFGVIDSKQNLSELEVQLVQNHWVIKVHRVTVYGNDKEEVSEDVVGVINYADFMKYKKKIEGHHLREYEIKMSDGIPSEAWIDKFNVAKAMVEEITTTALNTSNNNN